MDISLLRNEISSLKSNLIADETKLSMLEQNFSSNLSKIEKLTKDNLILERVARLLQKTAENQRAFICNKIELIGTSALQYVYGVDYELSMVLNQDKKTASCEIYVINTVEGVKKKFDPMNSKGGGIVDIVSLALRFAVLKVYNDPEIDGPVLLDEPGKHVSKEYSPLLSDFINTLSTELGRQEIVVTHNDFLAESANSVIRVYKEDNISKVERVS